MRQNLIRPALHWQMHVFGKLGQFGVSTQQSVGEFDRVGSGVADALDAVDGSYIME